MLFTDLIGVAGSSTNLNKIQERLRNAGYLKMNKDITINWTNSLNIYELGWQCLKNVLEIEQPQRITPLHPYSTK